jgi:hypothetical protein
MTPGQAHGQRTAREQAGADGAANGDHGQLARGQLPRKRLLLLDARQRLRTSAGALAVPLCGTAACAGLDTVFASSALIAGR